MTPNFFTILCCGVDLMNSFENADANSIGRSLPRPPKLPVRGRVQPTARTTPTVTEYKISILWGLYTMKKRRVTS